MPSTLGILSSSIGSIPCINKAFLKIDGADATTYTQLILNSGTAGPEVLSAQLGSTPGVDTNDPVINGDGTLSFAGQQHMIVADHPLLAFGSATSFTVTIKYRMNAASAANYGASLSKLNNSTGSNGWAILEKPAGNPDLTWAYLSDGVHPERVLPVASQIDGTWIVRTLVVNRADSTLKLYRNGALDGSTGLTTMAAASFETSWPLQFGGGSPYGGGVGQFPAPPTDFRILTIHDTALTPDDIFSLYEEIEAL